VIFHDKRYFGKLTFNVSPTRKPIPAWRGNHRVGISTSYSGVWSMALIFRYPGKKSVDQTLYWDGTRRLLALLRVAYRATGQKVDEEHARYANPKI
jgi:hypothetical protein